MIWLEQALVVIVGVAVGTLIGVRLGAIIMPLLGFTELGSRILPPFMIEVNWSAIGTAYSMMAITFIISLAILSTVLVRLRIQSLLRLGEEA